jgi:hypothetical protein
MSTSLLNSTWMDKANVPLLDGVFDDSLSDHEWRELEELQRSSEGCLDSEGW